MLTLNTQDGKVIEQVNFAPTIQTPHVLDVTGDGRTEIFVPFVRNDSFFLSISSPTGRKRNQLFVTTGAPRPGPRGDVALDPEEKRIVLD